MLHVRCVLCPSPLYYVPVSVTIGYLNSIRGEKIPMTNVPRFMISLGIGIIAALCLFSKYGIAADSRFEKVELETQLVPSPAEIGVLLPPGYDSSDKHLPLMLLLHGGLQDYRYLEESRPIIDSAWIHDELPPMVIATPSCDRSFYVDYYDGSEKWETFVLTEVLTYLQQSYRIDQEEGTYLTGLSMGGLGALRMAFKNPDDFHAVAAIEPAIEPTFTYDAFYGDSSVVDGAVRRPDSQLMPKFGKPVDQEYWNNNHPLYIASRDLESIKGSGLQLYIEVGDLDQFGNNQSAEMLHRLLSDGGFKHEYRLLHGIDHFTGFTWRLADALRFIGRVSSAEK
jgi:S-formylglutathione hydrolase